jgi:hypothetical protein
LQSIGHDQKVGRVMLSGVVTPNTSTISVAC